MTDQFGAFAEFVAGVTDAEAARADFVDSEATGFDAVTATGSTYTGRFTGTEVRSFHYDVEDATYELRSVTGFNYCGVEFPKVVAAGFCWRSQTIIGLDANNQMVRRSSSLRALITS